MKKMFALLLGALVAMATTLACASDGSGPRVRRLIVPYTAGGGSDLLTRMLGQKLSTMLGEPVVVENKPGAGGYLAAETVAKSPADGYTLLIGGNALVVGPLLYASHKLDALKDFTPIGSLVRVTLVLVTSPAFPASNARELVQLARGKKPETYSYASTSPGIMMTTEQVKALAGIDLLRVPYRGVPEGFIDVTTGRVSVMFDSIAIELPNIKAGRAKALAVNSETRHPLLPDVPTLAESGIKGYEEDNYIGVLGPAAMDPRVVEKVNAALLKVLADPEFKSFAQRQGFLPTPTSSKEFADMITATGGRYRHIVNQLGIKPE
jgi:tripartite-type tricarboxylate transporter receptor subunit TctC